MGTKTNKEAKIAEDKRSNEAIERLKIKYEKLDFSKNGYDAFYLKKQIK